MQSAVWISKRDMRNRQGMATHCATWEWSKWEELRENPTTFLKLKSLHTQIWWFYLGRVKRTERKEEITTWGNKLSVRHLAWDEFNPPNMNCKQVCFMGGACRECREQDFPYKLWQSCEMAGRGVRITAWIQLCQVRFAIPNGFMFFFFSPLSCSELKESSHCLLSPP